MSQYDNSQNKEHSNMFLKIRDTLQYTSYNFKKSYKVDNNIPMCDCVHIRRHS
jgi:hypothetical protein